MKRLTTDTPQDNVSTALNLFYVKDGWTWARGGGPGPDYKDVSLCDYVRMIGKDYGLDMELSDEEIGDLMAELLLDGTETLEGLIATLYTAGWAFAELRERLKAYENTGMTAEQVTELLSPPPNPPLTLKELREMYGEPVWVAPVAECGRVFTLETCVSYTWETRK